MIIVYRQFRWRWDNNSGFKWNCSKVATMKLISWVMDNGIEEFKEDSFPWIIFLSMLLILSVMFVFNELQPVQWQRCLKYGKSFKWFEMWLNHDPEKSAVRFLFIWNFSNYVNTFIFCSCFDVIPNILFFVF